MKVPKIFHFIWVDSQQEQNPEPAIPAPYLAFLQTWKRHHPEWSFRIWNGLTMRRFVAERSAEFLPYYNRYRHWICRVDVGKVFILYVLGGIYVDFDMECLKPIEPLLEKCGESTLVVSREPDVTAIKAYQGLLPYVPSNAFIATTAGNPILEKWLQLFLATQHLEREHILLATGPPVLYQLIEQQGRDKICLLDSKYLLGLEPQQKREQMKVDEHTYALHHWANSWCG